MTLALPLRLEGAQILDANGVSIALVRGEMAEYRANGAEIVTAVNLYWEWTKPWEWAKPDNTTNLTAAIAKAEQA